MIRQVIRRFFIAVSCTVLTVSLCFSVPLSAIAADYGQNQSARQQESQSYPSQSYPDQSAYESSQDASDYSYANKQTEQNKSQKKQQGKQQGKQSSQMDGGEKQYKQQSQSYPNK